MDERPRMIIIVEFAGWSWSRRMKGASFCQVERRRPVKRSRPCSTSGSHEWRGASPIFSARAIVIIVIVRG